jgi:rRNA maturation endonuclease Nob1
MEKNSNNNLNNPKDDETLKENQRWQGTCTLCGKDFNDKEVFRQHVSGHPRCSKCGQRFKNDTQLGAHAFVCTGTGEY